MGRQQTEKRGDKYGHIDEQGNIIIPFEYDNIEFRSNGGKTYFVVEKNKKWGIINPEGKMIGNYISLYTKFNFHPFNSPMSQSLYQISCENF